MGSEAIDANNYATMLDHPVGPQQLGTHCADSGAQCLRNHLFQPAAFDDFDIVVDQADQLSRGNARRAIVDRGVVEGVWVRKNLNAALNEFGEVGQCLRISRLVVDNNDLQVWIIRVVQQAFDTGVQQLVLVTCGYDQADTWQLLRERPVSLSRAG